MENYSTLNLSASVVHAPASRNASTLSAINGLMSLLILSAILFGLRAQLQSAPHPPKMSFSTVIGGSALTVFCDTPKFSNVIKNPTAACPTSGRIIITITSGCGPFGITWRNSSFTAVRHATLSDIGQSDTLPNISSGLYYASVRGSYGFAEPYSRINGDRSYTVGTDSDTDSDVDGAEDCNDNCPTTPNSSQDDTDHDKIGDVCDNCPNTSNPEQVDSDSDGIGDVCDNCPGKSNPDQADSDGDGIGNPCDICPNDATNADTDGDGVANCRDNCPNTSNPEQVDADSDGIGDVCDNCSGKSNPDQADSDGDGIGNVCDGCPNDPNKISAGTCGCGVVDVPNCGNTCTGTPDADCDGISNACDVCPGGNDQIDLDHDGRPDCKYPPSLSQLLTAWKCGGGKKVNVCHKSSNGKTQTLCVSYAEMFIHLAHGDYIGSCNNASCSSSITGSAISESDIIQSDDQYKTQDELNVNLYPNPARTEVNIQLNTLSEGLALIDIIDITGRLVQRENKMLYRGTNNLKLDLQNLAAGLHFIKVRDHGNHVVVVKLNKM